MRRIHLVRLFALVGMMALAFGTRATGAQAQPKGDIVKSYREGQGARPAWVEEAYRLSMDHLKANGKSKGLRDAAAELTLLGADIDDFGQTHVRLNQVQNGVPVFGGQLISHLDAASVLDVSGELFANVADTTPTFKATKAIAAAQAALGYTGALANAPTATLTVLPNQDGTAGSKLVYQVELLVEDGSSATGRYEYFIDATNGAVVWSYNNMDTTAATGSGRSLYSGTVTINTDYTSGTYYLRDLSRSSMLTYTMRNTTSSGYYLTDTDNVWGTGTNSDEDSAGVDAHFGAAKTWDYYLAVHNRRGIDGNGYTMQNRVHYGNRYNNAFWNGSLMTYGDGDGTTFTSLVSIDVVGHEITHGLTERTANLTYSGESGAANESFSDIFGTAVEYYTGSVGGRTPDYQIGEDIYTPGTSGDALRSMSNPGLYGDPDNYSIRYTGTDDSGGVHTNSGIQNQAFYLLAEGGTNRTSGRTVTGITRAKAERIFYRALTVKLTPSANFKAVRTATLSAAADLYGSTSAEYNATAAAWTAVGVN
jgi:thermolysin